MIGTCVICRRPIHGEAIFTFGTGRGAGLRHPYFCRKDGTMAKRSKTKKASSLAKAAARQTAAKGARGAKKTTKATKAARKRDTAKQGAQDAKRERKLSLLDEAVGVLKKSGQAMATKEMIEAILAKGDWTTKGKTPGATLYASILREIQKKGEDARFVKTERGKFALRT